MTEETDALGKMEALMLWSLFHPAAGDRLPVTALQMRL